WDEHLDELFENGRACASHEQFEDLHLLLFSDRKPPHGSPWIHGQAVAAGHLLNPTGDLRMIQHCRKVRQEEGDIFDHEQRGNESELLKDHADAQAAGIVWGPDLDSAIAEMNRACISLVNPIEDFDQRAL